MIKCNFRKARSSASRVSIERANLMVLPGKKYLEAGKVYESEANFCANEKLLKYSAKSKTHLSNLWSRTFIKIISSELVFANCGMMATTLMSASTNIGKVLEHTLYFEILLL